MHVRLSFLPRAERVLWTIIAHSLVRPHLIEALCDLVVLRAYALTKENIISCIESLVRRFGRGSDWKKVDVFGLASTQTLAGSYCGSKVLWQQLQDMTALEKLARSIASLRPNAYFFRRCAVFFHQRRCAPILAQGIGQCTWRECLRPVSVQGRMSLV